MRKTREFQLGESGFTNFYHVVSRVAGREILFGDIEKKAFLKIFRKQLAFSGLKAVAWCFMGNHFHFLLEVPDKATMTQHWTEEDYINRLKVLKDELATRMALADVKMFRGNGNAAGVTAIAERVKARLFDLSAFMKELKLKMTGFYNAMHGRKGTLWEGRFKSVLVEGKDALAAVAAYIDLNPLRAGMVDDPLEYRWCSYASAVAGNKADRAGLNRAVRQIERGRKAKWSKTVAEYRLFLYGRGEERIGGDTVDGSDKRKGGFTPAEIQEVWKNRGRLPLSQALRCRVRYFTDGVVLGNTEFVDAFFENRRSHFGPKRKSGARRMKRADWGSLRSLRDLKEPVTVASA
jgi:putative transposase